VKIIFWLSLAGVLYTYAGYPAIMWMLARLRPRPWKTAPIAPSVSLVLAVHNGVSLLSHRIQHLVSLDYPNIKEIIVVSDGSADGTAELLARQDDPRVHPILLEATADIIVFLDLRPETAPGAIQQLVSNFADQKVGCVGGEYIVRQEGDTGQSAGVGRLYSSYEQWIRMCESTFDSAVGVPGCFYAVRRNLAVPQSAGIILDDMFQPLSIVRQGYRSIVDPRAYVYDTLPKNVKGEFPRKVRTLAGNFQLIQLAPWTLTLQNRVLFQLVSHKVMRLVVPYLVVLMLVSAAMLSAGSAFYLCIAIVQLVCWAVALIGLAYRPPILHRIASPAATLLALNAAAVVGLYKFLFTRGPLWKIWNSDKSAASSTNSATSPGPVSAATVIDVNKN
jgi:cellulose synthase/poly-beta-1,6-N-acetylglucosamine synthase-like glycosyltransferase